MEDFKPFEDKEEVKRIRAERDSLIVALSHYDIPSSEVRFLTRKISILTEKLLEQARYAGGNK